MNPLAITSIDMTEPTAASVELTQLVREFGALRERLEQPGSNLTDQDFDEGWAAHDRAARALDRHGIGSLTVARALDNGELDLADPDEYFSADVIALSADAAVGYRTHEAVEDSSDDDPQRHVAADIAQVREAIQIAANAPDIAVDAALTMCGVYQPAARAALARSGVSDLPGEEAALVGMAAVLRLVALARDYRSEISED